MDRKLVPIYEWVWVRDGKEYKSTRSARNSAMLKSAALKLGGEVVRRQVGSILEVGFNALSS